MVQYGMRRYHAVQYSTARYDAIRYDSIGWCRGIAAGMLQCGMVWYNTIRYVQYTVRYNTMRFGMIGASGCRCIAGIGTLTTETSEAAAATGLSSGASSSAAASPHQRDCMPAFPAALCPLLRFGGILMNSQMNIKVDPAICGRAVVGPVCMRSNVQKWGYSPKARRAGRGMV